ncbi:unnamed protein product [Diatraea saccharalis]|uniref:Uncharacterized protein n=1 Tax=Diatraea saccharalis TaxID=40085 RepID=A0A9N9RB81_9NEOP|nr:unnamed protein product [Diatraea saccharalis]
MTDCGYVKAQSDNLPRIDMFMMSTYFSSNLDYTSAEIKGVKAASEEVGDRENQLMKYYNQPSNCDELSIHHLVCMIKNKPKNTQEFIKFCKQTEVCKEAALATLEQVTVLYEQTIEGKLNLQRLNIHMDSLYSEVIV